LHPPPLDVRRAIESFDTIDVVADEMREIIARDYSDLAAKLPPRKPPAPSVRRSRKRRHTASNKNRRGPCRALPYGRRHRIGPRSNSPSMRPLAN
jgi:hypothetical protein